MAFDYDHAFSAAKTAFEELDKRRIENARKISEISADTADVEKQMSALKQAMDIFAPFVADKPPEYTSQLLLPPGWAAERVQAAEVGMTAAIRAILNQTGASALSPAEVRDRLTSFQFDLSGYRNALAAIQTVLGRVAVEVETPEGKKYRAPVSRRRRYGIRKAADPLSAAPKDSQ